MIFFCKSRKKEKSETAVFEKIRKKSDNTGLILFK